MVPIQFHLRIRIVVALRGIAHCYGRSHWAKGRHPSGSWVQCPDPQHHRCRVSHAESYSHIQHAFSETTLLWAAKGDLNPLI